MALSGLRVLGALLLLNLAHEICGFNLTHELNVQIREGAFLESCEGLKRNFGVEFHELKYRNSKTYRRWTIRTAALQCLTTYAYEAIKGTQNTVDECLKHAIEKDYNTFYKSSENGGKCVYLTTSVDEELLRCSGRASAGYSVIYTISAPPSPYEGLLPDDQEFQSCSAKAGKTESTFTVHDTGSCLDSVYSVQYEYNNKNTVVQAANATPFYYDKPIPPCTVVNFTISRLLGERQLGDDACLCSSITPADEPQLVDNRHTVDLLLPPCEFLDYKIKIEKDGRTTTDGPFPYLGEPVQVPKRNIGRGTLTISFSSDFDFSYTKSVRYPRTP